MSESLGGTIKKLIKSNRYVQIGCIVGGVICIRYILRSPSSTINKNKNNNNNNNYLPRKQLKRIRVGDYFWLTKQLGYEIHMNTDQIICSLIGFIPSFLLLHDAIFRKNPIIYKEKHIKHKSYRVSGDWTLRFLYLTLCVTPINHLTGNGRIISLRQTFGLLSFYYGCIHLMPYIWYTLPNKNGKITIYGFIQQLFDRKYLPSGVAAFVLMIPLAITSRGVWKSRKHGLGLENWKLLHKSTYIVLYLSADHVIRRSWNRTSRGKSPVVIAKYSPFIVTILLGYRVIRYTGEYIINKVFKDIDY